MSKLILSISMYATDRLGSTTSPFGTPCCLSSGFTISVGSADLSVSGLDPGNREIVKVSQ